MIYPSGLGQTYEVTSNVWIIGVTMLKFLKEEKHTDKMYWYQISHRILTL